MKNSKLQLSVASLFIFLAIISLSLLSCKSKENGSGKAKIGAILPLTGNIAFIGENFKNGLSLALDEKKPKNLEIIYEDSKADPKEAVNATNKLLMDDSVKVIVSNLSSVTNAVIPVVLQSEKAVLLASLTSKSDITTLSPYIFRYFLSSQDEVKTMTSYFHANGIDNIGVLYQNDEFGKDALAILHNLFLGKITFEDTFGASDKDFKNLTAKVKNLNSLYLIGFGPSYGMLIKQLRETGYKGKIYAFSSLGSPAALKSAGDAANGAIFTGATFNPENPVDDFSKKFLASYQKKYNKLPDHYAAYGYDIGGILTQAISPETTSVDQIKNRLLSIGSFDGNFGKTVIDKTGDFHFEVRLYEVLQNDKISLIK